MKDYKYFLEVIDKDIHSIFEYQKEYDRKPDFNWLLYDFKYNVNKKTGKDNYILKEIDSKPYHYKRYTVDYTYPTEKRMLIITSANLTKQAWGSLKHPSVNAELGITWNSKFSFN